MRKGSLAGLALVGALVLASCAADTEPGDDTTTTPGDAPTVELSGTIAGVGASSIDVGREVWIANFESENPDVTVNYDPQGSGAGRTAFAEGGADFAGSDRALRDDELTGQVPCVDGTSALNLPIWISPIAIIFNIDGIESINLDAATIAGIFRAEISNWSDPVIAEQNPDLELPDLAISPVFRSDSSGTTDNFTEYLAAVAPEAWTDDPSGEWPGYPGEGAQGTSGVINAVEGGQGTIGYADASRAGELGTIAVLVGDEYVAYSPEAAAAVVDASSTVAGREANDLAFDLERDTTASGVYPIVLVAYAIVCSEYVDEDAAELVKAFLSYVASSDGQAASVERGGNAPLSSELSDRVLAAIESING